MYDRVVVVDVRPDDVIENNTQFYIQKMHRGRMAKERGEIDRKTVAERWNKQQVDQAWVNMATKGQNTYHIKLPLEEKPKPQEQNAQVPRQEPSAEQVYANHKSYFSKLLGMSSNSRLKPTAENFLAFVDYDDDLNGIEDPVAQVRLILSGMTANSMLVLRGHGSPKSLGGFSARAIGDGLVEAGLNASCFINLTGCKIGLSPIVTEDLLAKLRAGKIDDPVEIAAAITKDSFAMELAKALYAKGLANRLHARLRSVTLVTSETENFTRTTKDGKREDVKTDPKDWGRKRTDGWEKDKETPNVNKQPFSKVVITRGNSGEPNVRFYTYHSSDM